MTGIITSYCSINKSKVSLNGRDLITTPYQSVTELLSHLYKSLEINYPKFHKMDVQSKLGIIASELLIREEKEFAGSEKNRIALVFSNKASSLESDRQHARSISNKNEYFPSPSVFVYTLPNIVAGEIAIRHKITGENAFFISNEFDAQLMTNYVDILFNSTSTGQAMAGWLNVDEDECQAFVYWVKKGNFKEGSLPGQKEHNVANVEQLFRI
jgi:hypothetical protein